MGEEDEIWEEAEEKCVQNNPLNKLERKQTLSHEKVFLRAEIPPCVWINRIKSKIEANRGGLTVRMLKDVQN